MAIIIIIGSISRRRLIDSRNKEGALTRKGSKVVVVMVENTVVKKKIIKRGWTLCVLFICIVENKVFKQMVKLNEIFYCFKEE